MQGKKFNNGHCKGDRHHFYCDGTLLLFNHDTSLERQCGRICIQLSFNGVLFVAGFFYKREYHEHPEQYIGKRLLKLGGMLFLYNTVFTLLHNTLVSLKMISSTEHYSISKMISCIVQSLLMKYTEELLGACWFLPMFFIGTALFAIAFSKAEKAKNRNIGIRSSVFCLLLLRYMQTVGN